ncbi:MAG TPA: autotransporter-associated beta strand repeat-containing protein [Chthoniobacteraceae bacterium]|nr:autotransporter-associated beta strand repeat-containing protein [Chthoniobacteraceae bacterium]
MNRKLLLFPVAFLVSALAAKATTFDFTGASGLWNDASQWTARETTPDTVPTTNAPPARHSAYLGNAGRTLEFSLTGSYYLDNLSLDHSGTYVLRSLNEGEGTSNVIVLNLAGDLTSESGRLNFTNNTHGSLAINIAGDVILNGGELYFGTENAAFKGVSIAGNTTIASGAFMGLRLSVRGTLSTPTELGAVSVASGGTLVLNLGKQSSETTEVFRITKLQGGGEVSVFNTIGTSPTYKAYKGNLIVDSTGNDLFSGTLLQKGDDSTLQLTKRGGGTLTLSGENNYSGGTRVEAGKVVAAHASALGVGQAEIESDAVIEVVEGVSLANALSINGGELAVHGEVTGSLVFDESGGRITGTGTIASALAFNDIHQVIAPGEGKSTLSFGTSQSWEALTYEWGITQWDAAEEGYDQIAITGDLDLSGATAIWLTLNTFTMEGDSGLLTDFSENSQSWTLLGVTGEIQGFDAALWEIDADGFLNPFGGSFSVTQAGNELLLVYTIPEAGPTTLCLLGLALIGGVIYRRKG